MPDESRKRSRRRRVLLIAGVVVVLGVVVRIAMPYGVKWYVNTRIASMGSYSGHVSDVDISLTRGAYVLRGLEIVKIDNENVSDPFMTIDTTGISLQWNALFSGELVGEIVADGAIVNFVQSDSEHDTQLGHGVDWTAQIRQLFPFRFNRVEVPSGRITFRAPGIESDEDMTLEGVRLVVSDLTNMNEVPEEAYSDLRFAGLFMGETPLELNGRLNPTADTPTFDLDITLEAVPLVDMNPWLEEFVGVDAESGTFSLYAEFAAANGRFEGYAKPLMENAEIYRRGEETSGPFRRAWEGLVDFARSVFENEQRDQVATEIPLTGTIEDPEAGTLTAIANIVRNGFVTAFTHSLNGTISLRDLDDRRGEEQRP